MSRQLTSGVLGRKKGIDADLQVYLGSLTTALSSGQVALLNTFVKDLKSGLEIANLSDAFDVMYILANETSESGLNNLVKRSHDATLSSTAPTFTALEGFTGNGTSAYIDADYTPSVDNDTLSLNDASYGAYTRTSINNTGIIFGGLVSGSIVSTFQSGSGNRLHNTSADNITQHPAGMIILNREAAASYNIYQNKTPTLITRASTSLLSCRVFILTYSNNNAAPPGNYADGQVSFFFTGRSFSQEEVNTITDTFEAYMDANSKGVIA